MTGQLWHYDFEAIKEQLSGLEILIEEGYLPNKDKVINNT